MTQPPTGPQIPNSAAPRLVPPARNRMTFEPLPGDPRLRHALARLEEMRDQIPIVERSRAATFAKRAMDVIVAGALMVAFAPLFLALAAAVKLSSPTGPILFSQLRVGRGGRVFKFYKFRTMVPNAEALKESLSAHNEKDGPIFKMRQDPRVTPVGRWLRRYSLDELPQFINVIRGDMSLVGPRPPVPIEVAAYEPWQLRRLSVTPGLTCIWQTSGRSHVTFEQWVLMDLHYIDRWSIGLDVKLLCKTVWTVVTADGAY